MTAKRLLGDILSFTVVLLRICLVGCYVLSLRSCVLALRRDTMASPQGLRGRKRTRNIYDKTEHM